MAMKAAMNQQRAQPAELPNTLPPLRLADVPPTTAPPVAATADDVAALLMEVEALGKRIATMTPAQRSTWERSFLARVKSRRFLLTIGAIVAAAIGWASGTASGGEALLTMAGIVVTFITADTAQQIHATGTDAQVVVAAGSGPPVQVVKQQNVSTE